MLELRMLSHFAQSRRGNVAMITALLMPVFIISAAIAVDTGKIFASKRLLERSRRASSMARRRTRSS